MRSLWISAQAISVLALTSVLWSAYAQVPDGFVLHDAHKTEFTISLPQGWSLHEQAVVGGQPGTSGMSIFTSSKMAGLAIQEQLELMTKWDSGEVPNFFVDRGPSKQGMTCTSFSEKAQKQVVKLVLVSFSPGSKLEPPLVESSDVGGCRGVRVRVDAQSKHGTEWTTDFRAASDGKTLYVFTLRVHRSNFEKNLEFYDKAMSTLRFAAAP